MKAYFGRYATGNPRIREVYQDLFSSPPSMVALDIETPSVKINEPIGIGIATPLGDAFYFDISDPGLPWHLVQDNPHVKVRKVWHNAPFDLAWEALGKYGADIVNIDDSVILCRMLPHVDNTLEYASQWVQTQTSNMGDVLARYGAKFVTELPFEVVAEKCCRDALATMEIFQKFKPQIDSEYYEFERKFLVKLMQMSFRGLLLDKPRVIAIDRELEADLLLYKGSAQSLGFNPLSPQQVAISLNAEGYFLPPKRGTNAPDTSEEVLEKIPHPIAQLTLLVRKYNKLHGTYIHKWLNKERVFTHFFADAATGRTSSKDENIHNLPTGTRKGHIVPKAGKVRSVFIPDEEWGTKWDLNQIEVRSLAHLSKDKNLQAVLNDPNRDLHLETQDFGKLESRVQAKNVNFGIIYNGSDKEIAKGASTNNLSMIRYVREQWQLRYPDAWAWMLESQELALENLSVPTLFGRELDVTQKGDNYEKHLRNRGINYRIQGTTAEIFKRIFLAVCEVIPEDKHLSQIHDEGWHNGKWEIPEEIQHIMPFWTPIEYEHVKRFG